MNVHVGEHVLAPLRLGVDAGMAHGIVTKLGGGTKPGDPVVALVRFDDARSVRRSVDLLEPVPHPSLQVPLDRVSAVRDALAAALPAAWQPRRIENSPESIVVTFPDDGTSWLIWAESQV